MNTFVPIKSELEDQYLTKASNGKSHANETSILAKPIAKLPSFQCQALSSGRTKSKIVENKAAQDQQVLKKCISKKLPKPAEKAVTKTINKSSTLLRERLRTSYSNPKIEPQIRPPSIRRKSCKPKSAPVSVTRGVNIQTQTDRSVSLSAGPPRRPARKAAIVKQTNLNQAGQYFKFNRPASYYDNGMQPKCSFNFLIAEIGESPATFNTSGIHCEKKIIDGPSMNNHRKNFGEIGESPAKLNAALAYSRPRKPLGRSKTPIGQTFIAEIGESPGKLNRSDNQSRAIQENDIHQSLMEMPESPVKSGNVVPNAIPKHLVGRKTVRNRKGKHVPPQSKSLLCNNTSLSEDDVSRETTMYTAAAFRCQMTSDVMLPNTINMNHPMQLQGLANAMGDGVAKTNSKIEFYAKDELRQAVHCPYPLHLPNNVTVAMPIDTPEVLSKETMGCQDELTYIR